MDRKKAFQKVIGAIRADVRVERDQQGLEYPKAMMTARQDAKNTATVNCGGDWVSPTRSMATAKRVMGDERFEQFLKEYNALATIEAVGGSYPYFQIRVTFCEAVE